MHKVTYKIELTSLYIINSCSEYFYSTKKSLLNSLSLVSGP